jgi:hypothetical protein
MTAPAEFQTVAFSANAGVPWWSEVRPLCYPEADHDDFVTQYRMVILSTSKVRYLRWTRSDRLTLENL